jgi:plastocyanin
MRRSGFILAGALALALLAGGAGLAGPPAGPRTHTVLIESMKFSPAEIRVRPGDTVIFRNSDLVPHTVTERTLREFDSDMINPGATWKILCAREGTLEYRCIYHPPMLGRILVGDDAANSSRSTAVELCGAPAAGDGRTTSP